MIAMRHFELRCPSVPGQPRVMTLRRLLLCAALCGAKFAVGAASPPRSSADPQVALAGTDLTTVQFDPNDSSRLIASRLAYGSFESEDGGASWSSRPEYWVAFDPSTPGREYGYDVGYVSRTDNDDASGFTNVYHNPDLNDPFVNLAVGAGGRVYFATAQNVVSSDDGGATWVSDTSGLPTLSLAGLSYINAFEADPADPDVAYILLMDGSVYRRDGSPGVWTQVGSLPSSAGGLTIDPHDPQIMFAEDGGGIYRSADQGQSWTKVLASFSPQDCGVSGPCEPVGVSPSDPTIVYASEAGGVARSTDAGQTFSSPVDVFQGEPAGSIAVDPTDPSTLFTVTAAGIFVSHDGAQSWQPANNGVLESGFIRSVASDPTDPDLAYAGTEGGFWRTSDGGSSWAYSETGLPPDTTYIDSITIDPVDHATLYIQARDQGYYVSHDNGQTWSTLTTPAGFFPSPVEVDPSNASHLLIPGGSGITESNDAGQTWHFDRVCCATPPASDYQQFTAVAVDPADPAVVYAGGEDGVWRTVDGQQTWTHVLDTGDRYLGGNGWPTVLLDVDPNDPTTIFWASNSSDLEVSRDGGETWQDTGIWQPQTITFDPSTTPTTVYATSGVFTYRSTDRARMVWVPDQSAVGGGSDADALADTTTIAGVSKPVRRLYMANSTVQTHAFVASTPATAFRTHPKARWQLIKMKKRTLAFTIRCRDSWNATCRGQLQLRHKGAIFASTAFTISDGTSARVAINLRQKIWTGLRHRAWRIRGSVWTRGADRSLITDNEYVRITRMLH